MDTNEFLDLVIAGEPSAARDKLNELLSARAFEALDARKVELAKTIFNGAEESESEESTEETTESE